MNEDLLDVFYIDEESPTWLSYAIDRLPKRRAGDHAGRVNEKGYPEVQWENRFYAASRIVWALRNHEWLNDDEHIYCIDGNRYNLSAENMVPMSFNMIRYFDNLNSNYPGYWKHQGGYLPSIQIEGKRVYFGQCDTPEEAHARYRFHLKELIKEYGYGHLLSTE